MSTVLIVEDDALIAWSISETISGETGADVVIATSLAAAEEELLKQLDFALLDVNVKDDTTFALARRLASYGVPFAFASGSSRALIPDDLATALFLPKPCRAKLLVKSVRTALATSRPDVGERTVPV